MWASTLRTRPRPGTFPRVLTDERFATLITEAEKYLDTLCLGREQPETSYDCSGFVSYVLTNACATPGGWAAQGLYNISRRSPTPAGRPGVFVGTYDTSGISHVGIYVGDNMMLHCGDPISTPI